MIILRLAETSHSGPNMINQASATSFEGGAEEQIFNEVEEE